MDLVAVVSPAARIDRLLRDEPVIWLSTVRPEGGPHLVPVWFSWDGQAILVASKPGAQKVRNVHANPTVMVALGSPEDDFDVGLVEARAELLDQPAAASLPQAHLDKYEHQMAGIGLDAGEFLATYSQVMRIVPTRYLPWHGRTTPASATVQIDPVAARPLAVLRRVFRNTLRPVIGLRGAVA